MKLILFILFYLSSKAVLLRQECLEEVELKRVKTPVEDADVFAEDKSEQHTTPEIEGNYEPEPEEIQIPEESDTVKYTDVTVGYNYGDKVKKEGKDDDWNDGVVCINGKYSVNFETGTVLSLVDQDVDLTYRDGSGGKVEILVEVYKGNPDNPTSTTTAVDYGGNAKRAGSKKYGSYSFKKGDFIRVTFNKPDYNVANAPFQNSVDKVAVRLLKDTCNLSGG